MNVNSSRGVARAALGVALFALLGASACDWLSGSGPGARLSPFLSNPAVTPSGGVFCGPDQLFTFSFRYDDPQEDMFRLIVTLVQPERQARIEERVLWDDVAAADGRANFRFAFDCDQPAGTWIVSAQVEDARGHLSNIISAPVSLNSGG